MPDYVGDNRSFGLVSKLVSKEMERIRANHVDKPEIEMFKVPAKSTDRHGRSYRPDIIKRQLDGLDGDVGA